MFKNLLQSIVNFFKPLVTASAKELAQVALTAVVAEVPKVISSIVTGKQIGRAHV